MLHMVNTNMAPDAYLMHKPHLETGAGPQPTNFKLQATSRKLQATSSETSRNKPQATSNKRQASSRKLQAARYENLHKVLASSVECLGLG